MTELTRSLKKVSLRNYKSIVSCDLDVGPLVILIGPNGAGKSNFLDALRFVGDALRRSLADVVQERGGFREIRYRGATAARTVAIVLTLRLTVGEAFYGVRLDQRGKGYVVAREQCQVATESGTRRFSVAEGEVVSGRRHMIAADATELYLARMSRIEPFDQVFQHLTKMTFCNPSVDRIRELQTLDDGRLLKRDGSNLASVLRQLDAEVPKRKSAVDEYLHAIVPQIVRVDPRGLGPKVTLQFVLEVSASGRDAVARQRRYLAESMSDGTLRAVAVLVAMLQSTGDDGRASLVGIEEPESALHPGALGALGDAAMESSESLQTLLTTHSVELLDNEELPYDSIFPVEFVAGRSRIGALDDACVAAIERGDFTVAELLRMGQVSPRFSPRQRRSLFPRARRTA